MTRIIISRAHLPLERGAVSPAGVHNEYEWSGIFSPLLRDSLLKRNAQVLLLDASDRAAKIDALKKLNYNIWIEAHLNAFAPPAFGDHGLILTQHSVWAYKAADEITKAAANILPWAMKQASFWDAPGYGRAEWLFKNASPQAIALILELGFITNDRHRLFLYDVANLSLLADAIAKALT
jgi:N-acetylmuramoyl-L-alanine amidase